MGWGEPSEAPFALPSTDFGWGYGDPDPDATYAAASAGLSWSGSPIEWGWGDPAVLDPDWILWVGATHQPDDGGEILELQTAWPEIGPWRIQLIQHWTGTIFPSPTSPLPYCKSPVPGFAERCYTNIVRTEVGGVMVDLPGTRLRFVLPVLPPGIYDVKVELVGILLPPILIQGAFRVIYRNRALETYVYRNRFPRLYSLGQRLAPAEILLGIDPESDEEIT